MTLSLEEEAAICSGILRQGKLILYPTDTVWGIGCDATNEQAVQNIYTLKQRVAAKSLIILLASEKDIHKYVRRPALELLQYISKASTPVTAIYENGQNVAGNLLNDDGSLAIRVCRDTFCRALLQKLGKPLVSTSANVSGQPAPAVYQDVNPAIKNGVDYVVQHRQNDFHLARPSEIVKLNDLQQITILRP